MKTLIKLFLVFTLVLGITNISSAQTTKKDKQAAKVAKIKKMIDEGRYVFVADYAVPQRGTSRALTSEYDLRVTKDTVTTFLPYYGRAYQTDYGATDGGIKITSTNFDYNAKQNKKGGYEILIKPKDGKTVGVKDVRTLRLTVSADGYASLQVTSTNRDPISFNGYVEEIKPKK